MTDIAQQVHRENQSDIEDVPEQFMINSPESANWVIRKIVEARAYLERCREWAEREKIRAKRTEEFFLNRYGQQLCQWTEDRLAEQGGRRKSIAYPAGVVGFRHEQAKLVIENEAAVAAWAKVNRPALIVITEHVSKSGLNDYVKQTGELPDAGVRVEPEHDKFYVR